MLKAKDKEKVLKTAKDKKQIAYKGAPSHLATAFSTGQEGLEQHFQKKTCHLRIFYPAKSSLKYEGEIQSFLNTEANPSCKKS